MRDDTHSANPCCLSANITHPPTVASKAIRYSSRPKRHRIGMFHVKPCVDSRHDQKAIGPVDRYHPVRSIDPPRHHGARSRSGVWRAEPTNIVVEQYAIPRRAEWTHPTGHRHDVFGRAARQISHPRSRARRSQSGLMEGMPIAHSLLAKATRSIARGQREPSRHHDHLDTGWAANVNALDTLHGTAPAPLARGIGTITIRTALSRSQACAAPRRTRA